MNFEQILSQAKAEWQALQESDKPLIFIGYATCGKAAGADGVWAAIEAALAQHHIEARIVSVGCIGPCYLEPLVDIMKPGRPRISYGNVTPELAVKLIEDYLLKGNPRPDLALGTIGEGSVEGISPFFDMPMLKPQVRIASRRCGFIDPENIDHFIATGGYASLVKALGMKPEEITEEVKKSGLRGRGGAGFPTWEKWEEARKADNFPKYVVCNADEGDPGAFMNRSLLEGDPHTVLEGMAIAGYAIGTPNGHIYVRAEYPLAVQRLYTAIGQAKEKNLLGDNILGSNFSFHIEIMQGAGAFVCGEGSALMYSIEGKRGMPRVRPPRSVASGLWGLPTSLNNVETFAHVPVIVANGGDWFAKYGTERSKGTKTFSLVGKVKRTGLIEVPMGITLRQVIYEIGGGILDDKPFKAVQTGGPSGGCLPTSLLDLPVDFESLAKAGSIMGSGGMVVMDADTCMVDLARYFVEFCRDESCGKCVPCREGLLIMADILNRITSGRGVPEDIDQLMELSDTICSGSLCGLGKTAPNPVLSSIRYFREEWEAHVYEKRCSAIVCKDLIHYEIVSSRCVACHRCLWACPSKAITGHTLEAPVINQTRCNRCGTCLSVCPAWISPILRVPGPQMAIPSGPQLVEQEITVSG